MLVFAVNSNKGETETKTTHLILIFCPYRRRLPASISLIPCVIREADGITVADATDFGFFVVSANEKNIQSNICVPPAPIFTHASNSDWELSASVQK